MKIVKTPYVCKPVGWMRCIACSDYKRHPGKMWLGYNHLTHEDLTIDCPKCHGTGQVERYQYLRPADEERNRLRTARANLCPCIH